jgi:IS30 family transposase
MAHKHIGPEDWSVIARMLKAGFTGSEIARTLGKDPSAVNRHIKQNGSKDGYDGKTFWIREFLAGMRLCRRFAPTPFRLLIPISSFGGDDGI